MGGRSKKDTLDATAAEYLSQAFRRNSRLVIPKVRQLETECISPESCAFHEGTQYRLVAMKVPCLGEINKCDKAGVSLRGPSMKVTHEFRDERIRPIPKPLGELLNSKPGGLADVGVIPQSVRDGRFGYPRSAGDFQNRHPPTRSGEITRIRNFGHGNGGYASVSRELAK